MKLRPSRQGIELAYSIFLIILIPACLAGSTLWFTSQTRQAFDQELRRKANLANEVFSASVSEALTTNASKQAATTIQSAIEQAHQQAPEIVHLSVTVPQGGGFTTVASSDIAKIGTADTSIQTQLAWSKIQPIASLVAEGESNDRQWLVASPVLNPQGDPIAITTMRVSAATADATMAATLQQAFIVLAVTMIVIILLLLHHFRFVQYAELFRKQKELDQMKDDFISIATHELKAPMSIIKGYLSMILEEKDTLPKGPADMAQIAFEQTDRLGRLVTDLLDVSRIEQGRTTYRLRPFDLTQTIQPMINTFKAKADEKHLSLQYAPPTNLPAVNADPDRVSEVFTNLIDNAIKYSRSGTVRVEHTLTPTMVVTAVADTGIGMTPDEQSRLFQRFYRAKNAETRDIAGTGLGLWIIKQYIEHMGGSIIVTSDREKGSTFSVSLPRAIATAQTAESTSSSHT